jgi:hypothetical protein
MLDSKLQIKSGQTLALVNNPREVDVAAPRALADTADAVLVFAETRAEFEQHLDILRDAAQRGALAWLAYPKARQLGTDLNRDLIRDLAQDSGIDQVRQVSIDDVWSALRLKPLV